MGGWSRDIRTQGNLKTGDVIEAMRPSDGIYPVTLNGYIYHVQNTALLLWFARTPFGPLTGPGPGVYKPNTNTLNNGHNPNRPAGCAAATPPTCWVYGEASAGFFFGPPY